MSDFPWLCPKCGACIGYVGRFWEWWASFFGFSFHDCPGDDMKDHMAKYDLDKD